MTAPPVGSGFGGRMGFLNPIIGGNGMLIRNSIQSPNFVPGVSGWSINKDGTAQFYGLTITGGGFIANSQGQFFYQGVPALGNLIMAITGSTASGTDQFGNVYTPGGTCIIGNPNATSLFSVIDQSTPPNVLAGIAADGSFSTEGTLSADTDINIGGLSWLNDILPALPQGEIARANVSASALPAPGTATSSEFYLYELDVQLAAGRSYLLVLEPLSIKFSGAGGAKINIYATTDGSQPTNASTLIAQQSVEAGGSTGFSNIRSPTIEKPFSSSAGLLWRFLVSFVAFGTGTTPTLQLVQNTSNPGDDAYLNTNARMSLYDMGASLANTGRPILSTAGGSGGGTQNYTKTYTCTASHSYQGSDGGNPNNKINDNGSSYQGGDFPDTYNGKAKTWFQFNASAIQSDLSGATVNKVQVYLNNNHTWYSGGMTAAIGWDNKGSFGSTAGDPSGTGIDAAESHFNEGQGKWVTVPNSFGNNFANGNATQIVLFKNSNSLQYYGFFAGANQNGPCQLKISYTK